MGTAIRRDSTSRRSPGGFVPAHLWADKPGCYCEGCGTLRKIIKVNSKCLASNLKSQMTAFISWYLLITVLGWLTFPLAHRLFSALSDRGYILSRAFGLLIWGYVFWLSASLGIAQNDLGGLLLGLVILGSLSVWAFVNQKSELTNWLQSNRRLVITTEILFLVAFGLMASFRAANPEIVGTEKPMELMFINGIMNSPAFPPRDLWLSGYSISYYYFGYVMASMLAIFTGTPATMAFNLMIALIFGLSAVGAYGVLYNLLAQNPLQTTRHKSSTVTRQSSVFSPLLAPSFFSFSLTLKDFWMYCIAKDFSGFSIRMALPPRVSGHGSTSRT